MKKILLSFDIEEFDMPAEYGKTLPFEEQIRISTQGSHAILDVLAAHGINATFFSTVVFAKHAGEIIARIGKEHHELASHGYYHSQFEHAHLAASKNELEKLSGKPVTGFRMARMMPVDDRAIAAAGYRYNSSLNPVYLPGRYNNFFKPRTLFEADGLLQLPASAVPGIRFPLFWLSFHNLPLWLYKTACAATIQRDGYLNTYFHPWEFIDLGNPAYGMPGYVARNSGQQMIERFDNWIRWAKKKGYGFTTIGQFLTDRKS
jgi:peptidoglycan/xylan/chitin deacetylase (PgdA/CDA1 family)